MSPIELSRKDKEILYQLSINARITITHLAKKVKLSKQVVSYRLKLLEKKNVILGYHAITNIYRLGKTHYRVFIKYQNMSSEKEEEFMNYLKANPKVVWIAYFDGELDAAYLVWAENIREFEQVFEEINEKFGQYFQKKYFSISTKIEYLKYRFLSNKNCSESIVFGDCYDHYKLDQLDRTILNELNKNARITLVELAQRHGSSAKVIKERIKKLEKKKIIIGYNIKLNHNILGYTHRKVLLKINDSSKQKSKDLVMFIKNQQNVIYIVKPIGEHDLEFELMTKSNEEFHQIIKALRTKFAENIKSYNTVIHYKEPKSGQSFIF